MSDTAANSEGPSRPPHHRGLQQKCDLLQPCVLRTTNGSSGFPSPAQAQTALKQHLFPEQLSTTLPHLPRNGLEYQKQLLGWPMGGCWVFCGLGLFWHLGCTAPVVCLKSKGLVEPVQSPCGISLIPCPPLFFDSAFQHSSIFHTAAACLAVVLQPNLPSSLHCRSTHWSPRRGQSFQRTAIARGPCHPPCEERGGFLL